MGRRAYVNRVIAVTLTVKGKAQRTQWCCSLWVCYVRAKAQPNQSQCKVVFTWGLALSGSVGKSIMEVFKVLDCKNPKAKRNS